MENKKPIILAIKETENKIVNIVNESGLPAFFILQIFEKLHPTLITLSNEELKVAEETYKKQKDKKEKKEENND